MKTSQAIIALLVLTFFISCSNSSNPINPSLSDISNPSISSTSVSEYPSVSSAPVDTRGVFGVWKIKTDLETMTAEVVPSRNATAIGHTFDSDLSQFLTVSPCSNCLIVSNLFLNGYGDLNITVKMKHPFGNIASRPDLHGFDVRGIIIAEQWDTSIYTDIDVMRPDASTEDAILPGIYRNVLNPDGYTSHYDELVTDSRYFLGSADIAGNLNPFLRFFENYSIPAFDPHAPFGQNVMAVGSSYSERNIIFDSINLQYWGIEFYIVADVAYGQSAVLANRTDPQYYLPSFHRTEPWRIEYWIENNNLTAWDNTSTAEVVVQVFDWQHGYTVDANYPDPANLEGLAESSDVLQLELSIPGYQPAPIIQNTPVGPGTGAPDNPLEYRFTVTNEENSGNTRVGLLAVRDSLYGQASPSGRLPVPVSPAGFPYETLDILDYTLYHPIVVNMPNPMIMGPSNFTVENEISINWEELYANGKNTIIKPDFFMDQGHKKFQYKWDFDYDGVTFDLDGSGLPSENIIFPTGGRYDVGLRVRTNSVPPREYLYSMPVYSEGEGYHNTLQNLSVTSDATSGRHNYSITYNKDKIYTVFLHEMSNQRDVWLSIGDKDGSFQNFNITNNAEFQYEPCIYVINSGHSYDGIYIIYTQLDPSNGYIYFTKGNLDGSGFTTPIRVTTGDPGFEFQSCLVRYDNKLYIYYTNTIFITGQLFCSWSDDWGTSWNPEGWIADNTSIVQFYANPIPIGPELTLVWEDWIDPGRGADIVMSTSSDWTNFTEFKTLPLSVGDIGETRPSCSYYYNQLGIGYLSHASGTTPKAHLAVYNTMDDSLVDYPIQTVTNPALSCNSIATGTYGEGRFTVAVGYYDTGLSTLNLSVSEVYQNESIGSFSEWQVINQNYGSVTDVNTFTNPGIVCNSPNPYCTEVFVVWTRFNLGVFESTNSPNMDFGQMDRMYYVTDRFFRGWF